MAKLKLLLSLIISIIFLSVSIPLNASDLEKEKRWASQVVSDLFDGEAVYLNDGDIDFLGLWTETVESSNTAIIIIHGIGAHPDWPQVINPLRVALAEYKWPTLSIQMPILSNEAEPGEYDALMTEVPARIDAAIALLNDKGYNNIIIVAHSMGARMASYYLEQTQEKINAFVGIGMNVGSEASLAQINLPVLDLFGSNDLEGVLASLEDRKTASTHNQSYRQEIVNEADHFFNGLEDSLIEIVVAWLDDQVPE